MKVINVLEKEMVEVLNLFNKDLRYFKEFRLYRRIITIMKSLKTIEL